jgi:hypothetical protein
VGDRTSTGVPRYPRHRGKELGGDQSEEELVVSCGDFAPEADGSLCLCSLNEIYGHVLEGCEVGGGIFCAQATFVVSEGDVLYPVKAVLDGAMNVHEGAIRLAGRNNEVV